MLSRQEPSLTQGSNLGLLHCRQILYYLSHQGALGGANCLSCLQFCGSVTQVQLALFS